MKDVFRIDVDVQPFCPPHVTHMYPWNHQRQPREHVSATTQPDIVVP